MKKHLLLAAAAVSAIGFASTADAASLFYRAGAGALTDSVSNPYLLARELNFGTGVSSTLGQFDTVIRYNGDGIPAGTYNVTITFAGAAGAPVSATQGAVFATAIGAGTTTAAGGENGVNLTAANAPNGAGFVTTASGAAGAADGTAGAVGATLTRTSGGGVGESTVTFTLFVPAGGAVRAIGLTNGLTVRGPVTVTTNVINQTTNTAFEPGFSNLVLINTNGVGFAARVLGALDRTATLTGGDEDTRIIEGAGASRFSQLAGLATGAGANEASPYQVGQVQIAVADVVGNLNGFGAAFGGFTGASPSPLVYKDLNGTLVAITDVTQLSTTVQGLLGGLTFSQTGGGGTTTVTSPTTSATNVLTVTPPLLSTYRIAETTPGGGAAAPQLNPTDLAVTGQLFLGSAFINPAPFSGNFETIQTDGFTYIIPWVSTATQAAGTGNRTIIRVSRITSDDLNTSIGRVYAQLINPTNPTGVTSPGRSVLLTPTTGALTNGELVIDSSTLEAAFGNFGRADIRLTITSTAQNGVNNIGQNYTDTNTDLPTGAAPVGVNSYIVKRIIANTAGGLTEMEVVAGAPGAEANLPANQSTGY